MVWKCVVHTQKINVSPNNMLSKDDQHFMKLSRKFIPSTIRCSQVPCICQSFYHESWALYIYTRNIIINGLVILVRHNAIFIVSSNIIPNDNVFLILKTKFLCKLECFSLQLLVEVPKTQM